MGFLFFSTALSAQFYKLHDSELGVSATGQFTTTISAPNYVSTAGQVFPLNGNCYGQTTVVKIEHQGRSCFEATPQPVDTSPQTINGIGLLEPYSTDSLGVLVTFRERPVKWATIEWNYQYTKFSERFYDVPGQASTSDSVFVPASMQEATTAYVLRFHQRTRVKQFLSAGGGGLFFSPMAAPAGSSSANSSQWRGMALVEAGMDLRMNSRLGLRLGARSLIYRAPSFALTNVGSTWVSTEEPYAGVYVKLSKSGR